MEWRDKKRYSTATSNDEQIDFYIYQNKKSRFYIEAYGMGGQKMRLPFQDFATVDEAKSWVEEYENEREAKKASRPQNTIRL